MTTGDNNARGNSRRRESNRADLVWQMWYGYSPEDAAARVGMSPRTLQRHITALLESDPDPDDFVTREVIARLRHRDPRSGPDNAWEATAPAPAPNGRVFHDYAYGQSRPDLRPAITAEMVEQERRAAILEAVARLTAEAAAS